MPKSGKPWAGNDARDLAEFGTTQIGNLPHEGMLSGAGFDLIKSTGGTAGVISASGKAWSERKGSNRKL